jgi:hypothetical protein
VIRLPIEARLREAERKLKECRKRPFMTKTRAYWAERVKKLTAVYVKEQELATRFKNNLTRQGQ